MYINISYYNKMKIKTIKKIIDIMKHTQRRICHKYACAVAPMSLYDDITY